MGERHLVAWGLLVVGALLFFVPLVVADLTAPDTSDPGNWQEGLGRATAVLATSALGLIVVIVGVIVLAIQSWHQPHGQERDRTRDDVGADVHGQWACAEHDLVGCPICPPPVHRRDSEPARQAGDQ